MRARVRRLIVASVVLLALGLGVALVVTGVWRRQVEDELRRQALDLLPHVAQRIRDFHRVKVDKGRKVWEVSARDAQYYEDEGVVVVTEPAVSFFAKDGQAVALRGREGKVFLHDQDLTAIDVVGDIRMEFGDYTLETDSLRYDRDGETIKAPGAIDITGKVFDLRGNRLEVDLSVQHLRVHENVRMVLRPVTKATEGG